MLKDTVNVADIAWRLSDSSSLSHALHQTGRLVLALALAYCLALLGKSARWRRVDDELFDFIAACFQFVARNLLVKHRQCWLLHRIITYLVVRRVKGQLSQLLGAQWRQVARVLQ